MYIFWNMEMEGIRVGWFWLIIIVIEWFKNEIEDDFEWSINVMNKKL